MFLTIHAALLQGKHLLDESRIPSSRLTAEVLLSHALRRDRSYLYAHPEQPLTELAWIHYGRYLNERMQGRPTQYITGRQEFYGRDFCVSPAVLIPRPETEHLVEAALPHCTASTLAADVGTGSGAIAITLHLETHCRMWATDLSGPALAVARRNAAALNASVSLLQANLAGAFASASLDVIVSNPPYIPRGERDSLQPEVRDHEPEVALFGGEDGYDLYRALIADSLRVLKPGGLLLMELGFKSLDTVQQILAGSWEPPEVTPDLAGIPRVIRARKP